MSGELLRMHGGRKAAGFAVSRWSGLSVLMGSQAITSWDCLSAWRGAGASRVSQKEQCLLPFTRRKCDRISRGGVLICWYPKQELQLPQLAGVAGVIGATGCLLLSPTLTCTVQVSRLCDPLAPAAKWIPAQVPGSKWPMLRRSRNDDARIRRARLKRWETLLETCPPRAVLV